MLALEQVSTCFFPNPKRITVAQIVAPPCVLQAAPIHIQKCTRKTLIHLLKDFAAMDEEKKFEIFLIQTVSIPSQSTNINILPFGFKLNDSNYKIWSKMLEVYTSELGQLDYLTMKILEPEEDDPSHLKWVTEDAIARGWLLRT